MKLGEITIERKLAVLSADNEILYFPRDCEDDIGLSQKIGIVEIQRIVVSIANLIHWPACCADCPKTDCAKRGPKSNADKDSSSN